MRRGAIVSLDSAHLLVKNGSPAPVIGLAGPTGETVARILDLYPRTCPSDRLTGGDRVAATQATLQCRVGDRRHRPRLAAQHRGIATNA